MPTLYQGICSECGHKTAIMPEWYGAVLLDEPVTKLQGQVAGATLHVQGAIAEATDDRLLVLAHPIEDSILSTTGYSWSDLVWQGRYVVVSNVACRDCGNVFSIRRLGVPGAVGCLPALLVGSACGIAIWMSKGSVADGLITGFVVLFVALLILELAAGLFVKYRHAARANALASEKQCPVCQSVNAIRINRTKKTPCPACHRRSQTFHLAGIS